MTRPTTPMAYSGSGWSNGIAAQLNLPSISTSRLLHGRTPSRAGGPSRTRQRLVDDALEQLRLRRAIDPRRHGLARFCQFGVGVVVERRPGAARLRNPAVEIASRHRLDDEPHLGKAVAAEIRRETRIFAGLGREQVEVGGHPSHRVDL